MPKYLTRARAAEWLTAQGVPTTYKALEALSYEGKGPRSKRINGRIYYTVDWLTAWLEAPRTEPARRRRSDRQPSAA